MTLQDIQRVMEERAGTLPLANTPQEIVPAEGNPEATIMFIGEAAGYHELQQRRPFVGVSGQLLTKTMEANGFPRASVWISNIVKARPPANRDPLPKEIDAYRPFLDAEIAVLKPKIIVTLGRFSMGKFLGPDVRIGQIHGVPRWITFTPKFDELFRLRKESKGVAQVGHNSVKRVARRGDPGNYPSGSASEDIDPGRSDVTGPAHRQNENAALATPLKFVLLPMYHPAAALRAGAMLKAFEEDFKKIRAILEKLERDKMEAAKQIPVNQNQEDKKETEQLSLL